MGNVRPSRQSGPDPRTDRAATGHTVQFGTRKSWGGATPRGRDGKSGRRAGRGAWRVERQDRDAESWEGSQFGAWGPAPPRSQAQLRSSPGLERFGSQEPINSREPGPSRGLGIYGQGQANGVCVCVAGGSCNTPSRAPEAQGAALLPHPACAEARRPPSTPCPPSTLRWGSRLGRGSPRANLGRPGYHHALAGKTTPSPPPRPCPARPSLSQRSGKFRGPRGAS